MSREKQASLFATIALLSMCAALAWILFVAREIYYALYKVALGEIIDGLLIVLLGLVAGLIGNGKHHSRRLVLSVLGCLFVCFLFKVAFYLSPALMGPEAFNKNIKALTELTPEQHEAISGLFISLFTVVFLAPTICLIITLLLLALPESKPSQAGTQGGPLSSQASSPSSSPPAQGTA